MIKYVCCIPFCLGETFKDPASLGYLIPTVLLLKNRGPDSLIGKLNGIGGKIKLGESPIGAMKRKFREEAGLDIEDKDRFRHFYKHRAVSKSHMAGTQYEVHWYTIDLFIDEFAQGKTQVGEEEEEEEELHTVYFPATVNGLNPFSPFHSRERLAMDMHFLLLMAYQTLTGNIEQNLG